METLEKILAQHPFFEGFSPEYRELLVGCASNVVLQPGTYLFREGQEASQFYLIRQGKVALEVYPPQGPSLVIQTVEEGEILGWSWLIPPYKWGFDARAVNLVRAVALDGTCLRHKCEENHDLGYEFLKRFAYIIDQRLQATRLQLLDVYAPHV
jgi:CRP/FNR family transcriptional regulator, cyclic AMP receptor protein